MVLRRKFYNFERVKASYKRLINYFSRRIEFKIPIRITSSTFQFPLVSRFTGEDLFSPFRE